MALVEVGRGLSMLERRPAGPPIARGAVRVLRSAELCGMSYLVRVVRVVLPTLVRGAVRGALLDLGW